MRVVIRETRATGKDLDRAPKRVVLQYEIWARLVEEHGVQILRAFAGYRCERLQGAWVGHPSCRLNRQWRVIYRVLAGEIEIVEVCRVTPHDYRR